jgi:hypothetical protein
VYASSGAEDAEVPLPPLFPPPLLLPVLRLRGAPTTTGTDRLLGLGGTIMADTNGIFARVGLKTPTTRLGHGQSDETPGNMHFWDILRPINIVR